MRFERLAFLAGVGLFVWLLSRIGLAAVWSNLARIGWGFAAVLALETVVVLCSTLGWRQTLPPPRTVSFRSLFAMRMAGDGVNALAPAAVVGGELVRAGLLSRYVSGAQALGSVGLAAMTQFLAQVLFVGLGATVAPAGSLQPRLRIFGLAILAFFLVFVAIVRRLSRPRKAPRRLGRLLDRLGGLLKSRGPRKDFWPDLERHVFGVMRQRPGDLAVSAFFFLCGWLVNIVEISLVLALLGVPVAVGTAFSIAVLLIFVEGVFFFVPARVGIQEGGLYAIFLSLGLDPVRGFSLGLVRRLRELLWGLAGLAVLGFQRRRTAAAAQTGTSPGGTSAVGE